MLPKVPTRRKFIRNIIIGGAAVSGSLGLNACGSGGSDSASFNPRVVSFEHGVASGDPMQDRVVIWTRVSNSNDEIEVQWEMAEDSDFTTLTASGTLATDASRDYTVKVDVTGLLPDRIYYYRFRADQTISPVGRTRSLPAGTTERVRLAVMSCSNYPAGYFHVYAEIARIAADLNAAIHLGDYIYEYERDGYASADAAALGRVSDPAHELLTLSDYRIRYAQYRTDPDLQAFHANVPLIAVWDDHEIANDTWRGGAENHDPATEGDFLARRDAAIQAWYEWLPVRAPNAALPERIYRSFNFGDLVALHMLDTRVIARDEQLDYADFFGANGSFDAIGFATAIGDPSRQLLGVEQSNWLQMQMANSTATWQMLGQQVLIGRMTLPAPVALQSIGFSEYGELLGRAQSAPETLTDEDRAVLAQPSIPYNLDAWDGYAVARETLLGTARQLDKNLVVLSGDTHNAWANDLLDLAGNRVGVEFATPSVSSPGLEAFLTNENPLVLAAGVTQLIEPLQYANTGDRGFMLVEARTDQCIAEWRFVSTVKDRAHDFFNGPRLRTLPGSDQRRIEVDEAPV